jgi:hypothetical protein
VNPDDAIRRLREVDPVRDFEPVVDDGKLGWIMARPRPSRVPQRRDRAPRDEVGPELPEA